MRPQSEPGSTRHSREDPVGEHEQKECRRERHVHGEERLVDFGDIVSVLCRNAAILHLATSCRYRFGFEELVGAMTAEFHLGCEEEAALLALRRIKYSYRARVEGDPSLAALPMALRAVRRIAAMVGDLRTSSVETGNTWPSLCTGCGLDGACARYVPSAVPNPSATYRVPTSRRSSTPIRFGR